jgi:hypothetical protein
MTAGRSPSRDRDTMDFDIVRQSARVVPLRTINERFQTDWNLFSSPKQPIRKQLRQEEKQ